ncbi:hypothetical protein AVEN_76000-1 [Araneus ventricosus]|uniref:RNase H type-1 domain-containing protein n=1 Tax=Araneus ventricosus TaxID=182803 RepID=A0A4Y2FBJ0_ARAVE|nr:hypothetical protein AVEN_76000-1 [Araneus ventricosus]
MVLESTRTQSPIIATIKTLLRSKPNVKLNWVRAHVVIISNEMADQAARRATQKEFIHHVEKIPMSWIKFELKTKMRKNGNIGGKIHKKQGFSVEFFHKLILEGAMGTFIYKAVVDKPWMLSILSA